MLHDREDNEPVEIYFIVSRREPAIDIINMLQKFKIKVVLKDKTARAKLRFCKCRLLLCFVQ